MSNLIDVLAVVRGSAPEEIEREFDGRGYGDFKTAVAEEVAEYLRPVRERYAEMRADEAEHRARARGRRRPRAGRSPRRRWPRYAPRWASGRRL